MVFQQPFENVKHRFEGVNAVEVCKWQINFKDKFMLNYLYSALHDWAVEEGWCSPKEFEFPELHYTQRESSFGKEMRLKWRLEKKPDTDKGLFGYKLDLDFYFLGIKKADIVWKGQKLSGVKGEFELITKGWLIVDKDKILEKAPLKQIKNLYLDRIIAQKKDEHFANVYADAYRLRDFVMRLLKMGPEWGPTEGAQWHYKRDFT